VGRSESFRNGTLAITRKLKREAAIINFMLLVFGAGASYGSQASGEVPPLGSGLLPELRKANPDLWGQLTDEEQELFAENFEVGMNSLLRKEGEGGKGEVPHLVGMYQRALAAYLFSFYPTLDSLYVRLARRIAQTNWSGAIATLNYDMLLQRALGFVGPSATIVTQDVLEDEIPLELCLPHGSCALFVQGVYVRGATAWSADIRGQVVLIDNDMEHRTRLITNVVPPIMCYYEPLKRLTSGKDFIEIQRKRFRARALSADRIAIVGVSVNIADTHLWNCLAKSDASILYCGGSDGPKFLEWAASERPRKNNIVLERHFETGFDAICEHVGIT
jgi:hypothetical protein